MIPSGEQSLNRNTPLEHEIDKAEPENKRTAERNKYQQSGEPEKQWFAEHRNDRAESEKKRVAKKQQYWKSSEPGCLAKRVR